MASAAVYSVFWLVQQQPAVWTVVAVSKPQVDANHVEMMAAICFVKCLLEEADTTLI